MDWYAELSDHATVRELRHEVSSYLRRHGEAGSDVDGADIVVSELLANVARHAAGPAWVSINWSARQPVITVRDLGPGFTLASVELPPATSPGGRGLVIASRLAASLAVAAGRAGGSTVTAMLPVARPTVDQLDPPRRTAGALPGVEEARQEGGFGKETFLRALVVQLAQAAEADLGPQVAERLVAQVGADIGGQMEDEYRAARGIIGRMSPEQIADCLVRLKHAIDGDFYVIEISDERIVLGTDTCPFGEVVRKAPGLCRMTSSVFGGIAARNGEDGASVVLEERIAMGDPGCRVVVHLGPAPEDVAPFGNRFATPT